MSICNDNIFKKLNNLRKDFKDSEISKSGENKFQGFKYLELSDFMPTIIELNNKYGLCTHINIIDELATLEAVNVDKVDEVITFSLSIPTINNYLVNDDGINVPVSFNNKVQDTGKLETYIRRYLYMLYCEIAVDDEIDSKDNSKGKKVVRKKPFVKPKRV